MRSIEERNLKIGDYIKLSWIFDKWYEKLILVFLSALGFWKFLELLF